MDDKGTIWRAEESGSDNQYLIVDGGVGDGGWGGGRRA